MSISKIKVLESKLKRLNISCKIDLGRIVIGKATTDYSLIGLIILPFLIALFFICLIMFEDELLPYKKIIFAIIVLIGFSIFNFTRFLKKKKVNSNIKILYNKTIKINEKLFIAKNIDSFEFHIKSINDEVFEGNLYLIDTDLNSYQLLGFNDESEVYVLNDLQWFSDFMCTFVGKEIVPMQRFKI